MLNFEFLLWGQGQGVCKWAEKNILDKPWFLGKLTVNPIEKFKIYTKRIKDELLTKNREFKIGGAGKKVFFFEKTKDNKTAISKVWLWI